MPVYVSSTLTKAPPGSGLPERIIIPRQHFPGPQQVRPLPYRLRRIIVLGLRLGGRQPDNLSLLQHGRQAQEPSVALCRICEGAGLVLVQGRETG